MNSRDNNNRNRNNGNSNRSGSGSTTRYNSNRRNSTDRRSSSNMRGFGSDNDTSSSSIGNVRGQGYNSHRNVQGQSSAPIQSSPSTRPIPIQKFSGLSTRDQDDLDSFCVALKELTFNSRPIIEKLTGMARERAKSIAGPVSRTILDNLVFNHPKLKSCFLFLIDSISKSVGEPYPTSFVKHGLVSAYLRVFGEICASGDEGQKRDFMKVLMTWNGVFVPEALKEIESKSMISATTTTNYSASASALSVSLPKYSSQTMKLLKDLQGVFINPPGPHISGIVSEIFNRLARGGELSRETLSELDSKAKISDKSQIIEALRLLIEGGATLFDTAVPSNNCSNTNNNTTCISGDIADVPFGSTLNFELPADFQIDLSLLSSIVELNKLNTAAGCNSIASASSQPSSIIASPTKQPASIRDKHFVEVPLASADLLVSRPNLFKLLYDDLSLHCKICGVRFRDTLKGQERMTTHLDSHFRRNMRLKEKSKRVMARDWFGSENDWIDGKFDSESLAEKTVNIFEDFDAAESSSNQIESQVFIEATEEEQTSQVKCGICQEILNITWNDETEQWTFPGCIRSEFNQIIHTNCCSQEEIGIEIHAKKQKRN